MEHADVRYLESKRSVDQRARSRLVRDHLLAELADSPAVLDLGAGTGAALRALLDWGVHDGTYVGIDRAEGLIEWCSDRLPAAFESAYAVEPTERGFRVESLDARFAVGDVLDPPDDPVDLVVAQALLDLVPIPAAMEAIDEVLQPGGVAYLPITFDGVSVFQPGHPDDGAVVDAYHAAIDGEPGRSSRAGRELIEHLHGRPGELLAVAASDWIVRPRQGEYPAEEAHFLASVLGFVERTLADRDVDATGWLAERRRQLDAGELTYLAHNYDLLYRAPS